MSFNYLDFEYPILELEEKIRLLISVNNHNEINLNEKISFLEKKRIQLITKIFSNLNAWQITQLARHHLRPYTLDYINKIFHDFDELSGDRIFGDDKAVIGGLARLENFSVMIIGHQKGRTTKEKIYRNFGMPVPEGYRKALRLMKIAECFKIPIITFIDTPGAYPGIGAEKRGQSLAIANNLSYMSKLKVPIICTIIGEGGSGGALAIGIGDKINMLQYSIYSVISPEGCASILWKTVKKAPIAAESMGITAERLKELKLIDRIIIEPLGGAHKNLNQMANDLKKTLLLDLNNFNQMDIKKICKNRYERLMSYGYN